MVKAGLSLFFLRRERRTEGKTDVGGGKERLFCKDREKRRERGRGGEEGRKSVNAEEEEGSTTFSSPFSSGMDGGT